MLKWFIAFSFFLSMAQAQVPQGKLYLHTFPAPGHLLGDLGYIDYPSGQYQSFDSLNVTEMCYLAGRLYVGEAFQFNGSTDIRVYDTQTHQLTDSIVGVNPNQLATWKNKLIFSSYAQPAFRVYDLGGDSLLFALDSTKVPDALDILISGDSAYVSAGNRITVIDLNLRDTVATIELPALFVGVAYANWLTEIQGNMYIAMEYATGAYRSGLFRLNLHTLAADSVRHIEGYVNLYPFVATTDRLYFAWFRSYYNFLTDSLYLDPDFDQFALAYDAAHEALMVHDLSAKTVNLWYQDSLVGTAAVPQTIDVALFVPGSGSTAIGRHTPIKAPFLLFPNPAQDALSLQFSAPATRSVRIIDALGRTCWQHTDDLAPLSELRISLQQLSPGPYWVEVQEAGRRYRAAFIRQAD